MQDNDRNIYKKARMAAGITQEAAVPMLDVSVESLRAYETGLRIPPNDVVELMTIAYHNQALGLYHLRESGAAAREILPEVPDRPLPEAVLRLCNLIFAFADKHRDRQLMQIAEDGRIDEGERELFDEIVGGELRELVEAALAVRYAKVERGGQ